MRSTSRRRALAAALIGLAIALIAAGCGSSSSSGGGGSTDPASLLPAGTPLYLEASLNPSADQKTAFNSLSTKILGVADPSKKLIELIDKSSKQGGKPGLTYEKDIKPWLGDKLALGILSFANLDKPDFAAVIDTTDAKKALDEITKDNNFTTKGTTSGVDYQSQADGTRVGIIDDEIVVGDADGFAAVAAAQKGPKLSGDKTFTQARSKAPADRLGYAYIDVSAFIGLVAKQSATLENQIGSLQGLSGNVKAVGAALVAKPSAIEVDASAVGAKSTASSGPSTVPLAKAPGDAWAAFTVHHLGTTLNTALTELGNIGSQGKSQSFTQILSQLKQTTGLDLQKDLFSWMGDAGVFVRGTSAATIGGAVIIHSTNPAASAAAITKIQQLLTTLGRSPTPITDGFEVATSATGPKVQVVNHGAEFIIALGEGALQDAESPASTLDSTPSYQAAVTSLGTTPASGYVNLQTLFGLAEGVASSNADLAKVKPYLDAFSSVIVGGTADDAKFIINVK